MSAQASLASYTKVTDNVRHYAADAFAAGTQQLLGELAAWEERQALRKARQELGQLEEHENVNVEEGKAGSGKETKKTEDKRPGDPPLLHCARFWLKTLVKAAPSIHALLGLFQNNPDIRQQSNLLRDGSWFECAGCCFYILSL